MSQRKKKVASLPAKLPRKREKFYFYLNRDEGEEHRVDIAFKQLIEASHIDLDRLHYYFDGNVNMIGSDLFYAQYQPAHNRILFHLLEGERLSPSAWGIERKGHNDFATEITIDGTAWRHLCSEAGGWKEGYNPDVVPEIWVRTPLYL